MPLLMVHFSQKWFRNTGLNEETFKKLCIGEHCIGRIAHKFIELCNVLQKCKESDFPTAF